jgi:hypothetical protein|tara:strand:- start:280 stop:600 length:321 start_codon:yes stop_codon:yes gene_type:complete
MKNSNDKLVSLIMLCVTAMLLILWIYNYYVDIDGSASIKDFNLKNLVLWGRSNTDLILIIYVFSCLQLAGISEFKQRQDYLVVALISLIFTPIGLLFIKEEKNDGP